VSRLRLGISFSAGRGEGNKRQEKEGGLAREISKQEGQEGWA